MRIRATAFGKECRRMTCGPKTWCSVVGGAALALACGCQTTTEQSTASKSSLSSLFRARTVAATEPEPPEAIPDIKDPTDLSLAYARWMEDVGNLVEARRHYSEIADAKPKNLEAALGLARIDELSGRTHEAEQGFLRAQRLDPDSPEALHALGQFYAHQERWPQAVEQLNRAMLAAPAEKAYRYDLAVALVHTGDIKSAMPHFVRTVGDAEAHYNVGLILKDEGRLAEAHEHLLLAVTKRPDLHQAQYWLDEVRHQQETALASLPPDGGVRTAALQSSADQASPIAPTTGGHSPTAAAANAHLTPQQLQQRQNQRPAQW
jgi:tetratricopeptide (TPR) repeat protein